jgi:hypothetical protein
MAATQKAKGRLGLALWAERRAPALARAMRTRPVLPAESNPLGTVFRGAEGGPLLLLAGERGREPLWLASALAKQLGAVAVVLTDPNTDGVKSAATGAELRADLARVALIGAGDAAAAALATAADPARGFEVARLALLSPTAEADLELGAVPPVFLQSAPGSPTLPVSRALEIDLRESGVAVRPVEYAGLHDAWTRYPRLTPGSARALDDIAAFLRRGFGLEGTFHGVIPGWDLK